MATDSDDSTSPLFVDDSSASTLQESNEFPSEVKKNPHMNNKALDLEDEETATATALREPLLSESPKESASDDDPIPVSSPLPWKGLLFFRSLYFLSGFSAATWGRFGVIFYNRVKHLSSREIGIIQGVMPFISFFTMPIWGWIADQTRSRKRVYVLCKVLGTCSILCMALPSANGFWPIFFAAASVAVFRSTGVLDAHTVEFLGAENKEMYGSIRVWTAISWGMGAVIMGHITDTLGFGYNFILFGIMYGLQILFVLFGLPERSQQEQARYDNPIESAPRRETLWAALLRVPVALWLLEVCIIGAVMSLVDAFLFVFLQNDLNATTTLCGYSVGVTVLFEIPIFTYSKFLLRKVGHDILFLTAISAYIIRALCYTLLTPDTVHFILLLEVLHGITYASMWIASVDFSATVAPDEWKTTVQSILGTVLSCLGGGIGPLIGGVIMQEHGARFMYRCAACLVGLAGICHGLFFCCGWGHDAFLKTLHRSESTHQRSSD